MRNGDVGIPYTFDAPQTLRDWLGWLAADLGVLALVFGAVWGFTR